MTVEQQRVVEAVSAGCSIDEGARLAGRPVGSVRRWLTAGRKHPDGVHGVFARQVDEARAAQRLPDRATLRALTRDELEGLLAEKVRAGSVPAMRLWVDLHRAEFEQGEDPFAEFDPAARLRAVS